MRNFFVFLFLIISTQFVFSQNHVEVYVNNANSGKEISFAVVQNRMENFKIICDENGKGVVPIKDSTLIKVTAIGYEDYFHFIIHSEDADTLNIPLKQKTYELSEYVVNPYPTRLLFKKAIADLDLPDTNMISANLFLDPRLKEFSVQAKEYQGGDFITLSLGSPISSIYNLVSKRAKSERKFTKLKWTDNQNKVIAKKYNKSYVEQLLGIRELERIEAFMEYCKPSYEYILASTDYELACYVMNCYQSFLLNETDME